MAEIYPGGQLLFRTNSDIYPPHIADNCPFSYRDVEINNEFSCKGTFAETCKVMVNDPSIKNDIGIKVFIDDDEESYKQAFEEYSNLFDQQGAFGYCPKAYMFLTYNDGINHPAIVMDWIPGISLDRAVRELSENSPTGIPSIEATLSLLAKISNGLSLLHSRDYMVHRDLSTNNILVQMSRDSGQTLPAGISFIDLGHSKKYASMKVTPGKPGTAYYSAPEIDELNPLFGDKKDSPPKLEEAFLSELWSFGALASFIRSGTHPIDKEYADIFPSCMSEVNKTTSRDAPDLRAHIMALKKVKNKPINLKKMLEAKGEDYKRTERDTAFDEALGSLIARWTDPVPDNRGDKFPMPSVSRSIEALAKKFDVSYSPESKYADETFVLDDWDDGFVDNSPQSSNSSKSLYNGAQSKPASNISGKNEKHKPNNASSEGINHETEPVADKSALSTLPLQESLGFENSIDVEGLRRKAQTGDEKAQFELALWCFSNGSSDIGLALLKTSADRGYKKARQLLIDKYNSWRAMASEESESNSYLKYLATLAEKKSLRDPNSADFDIDEAYRWCLSFVKPDLSNINRNIHKDENQAKRDHSAETQVAFPSNRTQSLKAVENLDDKTPTPKDQFELSEKLIDLGDLKSGLSQLKLAYMGGYKPAGAYLDKLAESWMCIVSIYSQMPSENAVKELRLEASQLGIVEPWVNGDQLKLKTDLGFMAKYRWCNKVALLLGAEGIKRREAEINNGEAERKIRKLKDAQKNAVSLSALNNSIHSITSEHNKNNIKSSQSGETTKLAESTKKSSQKNEKRRRNKLIAIGASALFITIAIIGLLSVGLFPISNSNNFQPDIPEVSPETIDSSGTLTHKIEGYTSEEIYKGQLGDKLVVNSITDNPNVGDERFFVGIREDAQDSGKDNSWSTSIFAENEKTYVVRALAFVEGNGNATNMSVSLYPNGSKTSTSKVVDELFCRSKYTGDHKETYTTPFLPIVGELRFWDSNYSNANPNDSKNYNITYVSQAYLYAGQEFHVEYIEGSALLENNGIGSNGGIALSDDIVDRYNEDVFIGYESLDGTIPAGSQYNCYITAKFRVIYD